MSSRHESNTLGPVMIDLEGTELTDVEAQRLANKLVGGVILFTRNFSNLGQLKRLVAEIRAVNPNCLIAVDHEGGRVQRFKEGFTHLPPMRVLGRLYAGHPEAALSMAKNFGWIMAAELVCFDIDISFAPVLDRDHGVSQVIGDRAFSDDLDIIAALGAAFVEGMHEAGMANTAKHFPGHGAVEADSHVAIPVDPRTESEIEQEDMRVFEALTKTGMDAVMPAHVIYSSVDSQPAGFSEYWLQTVLRGKYGFNGVIFSDDLSMEGASVAGSFAERAHAALKAGCDMVLVCNNPTAADEVLTALSGHSCSHDSSQRISAMLHKAGSTSLEDLQKNDRWMQTRNTIDNYREQGESGLWKSLDL